MNFLNPFGFALLALAPVLVLLYLRRVRRKVVPVSSLLFWQRALGETRHRAFLGRLRQWLSLLLHLLILALIILAIVRPQFAKLRRVSQSTVIVLDERARMQAVEPDGVTRFEKALRIARQNALAARDGNSIALLAAGATPHVISPFTTEPADLTERLANTAPTDAGGDLHAALSLAQQLLATRPGGHHILLLTDSAPQSAESDVETVALGSPLDNVAITRFAARPEIASPQTSDLLLEIANFGAAPTRGNVEISCDGTLLDVRPFDLQPGARKTNIFPAVPRAGSGELTAKLDVKDALPLDNVAYALLPQSEPCRVLLVSKGNWFLEKLLAADDSVHFDLLTPDAFTPDMAANVDAVIFDDCGPTDLSAVQGNVLFLKKSPFPVKGPVDPPFVLESETASPLLRYVQWRNVTFLHADAVEAVDRDGWKFQTVLHSFDHPLIVTGSHPRQGAGEQRMVVFAFDFNQTDLPLRVAFPLLISNCVHWLGGKQIVPPESIEAGRELELLPDEIAAALPGGKPAVRSVLQPLKNGFYDIASESHPHRVAVNTFDDAELNLRLIPAPTGGSRAWSNLSPAGTPLWQWFAAAALALFSLEWLLFHRRRTE